MRQKFRFATRVVRRCSVRRRGFPVLLACLTLCVVFVCPPLAAQPPATPAPSGEPEDENRKAANISWNPKLNYDEWKSLEKRRYIDFDRKLNAASYTDAEKRELLKHLQNLIFGMTLEQNVDRHANIIDNITRATEQPGTSPAARDLILENALKLIDPLLKDQPPNVQYSLVLLAARLNVKPANLNARPQVPPQPYPQSQQILMRVLGNEGMPVVCRIIAARGLERLMRDGDISTVDKSNIGVALAKALEQKVENPLARKWYRWKLVEALGATGRYEETGYRPVMIDALMSVLTNRQDDWEVRAAAARAISQLPLDQKVNVELVNYEVVQLLNELAKAYMASDKTPPSMWRWAFDNIYLAYKAPTVHEQTVKHWGLMHLNTPGGREQIAAAYKNVVLPVVKPVLESQTLPSLNAKAVTALDEWLEKNRPPSRKVTPQSPELPAANPQPQAAQGQNSGPGSPPGGN